MSDLSNLLENAPRDCWLALSNDETSVVGRGENLQEAVEAAKENGEDDPILILAPKEWIQVVYWEAKMRKQYTGFPLKTPDPGVKDAIDWIPLLKVRVSAKHQHTPILYAVVDSGCPYCLFRAEVADLPHLDLRTAQQSVLGGIIGGPKDPVLFHKVDLVIENNWRIEVLAGFMKKLSVAAILGRTGFFDNFQVLFDHSKSPREFEITRIEWTN
jgi:hypothetical protein